MQAYELHDIIFSQYSDFQTRSDVFETCMNVFGLAYELTDRFNCRRKKCLPDSIQLTLEGEIRKNG